MTDGMTRKHSGKPGTEVILRGRAAPNERGSWPVPMNSRENMSLFFQHKGREHRRQHEASRHILFIQQRIGTCH